MYSVTDLCAPHILCAYSLCTPILHILLPFSYYICSTEYTVHRYTYRHMMYRNDRKPIPKSPIGRNSTAIIEFCVRCLRYYGFIERVMLLNCCATVKRVIQRTRYTRLYMRTRNGDSITEADIATTFRVPYAYRVGSFFALLQGTRKTAERNRHGWLDRTRR